MRHVRRELEGQVRKAAKGFPATVLTGPRRAGKTWLLRHLFPRADYFLLDSRRLLSANVVRYPLT
jgi:uncharacterized protein